MKRMSIRLRLTLWYVALLAVILAVFGGGVYFTLREVLYNNLDESIESQADALMSTLQFDDNGFPLQAVGRSNSPGESDASVVIISANDPGADIQIEDAPSAGTRVRSYPIVREGFQVGTLQIRQSDEEIAETLSSLLLVLGIAYPMTLLVAVLGGMFLASRALSPVDKITSMARRVTADDLGQRLDLDLPDDEVGRLAKTFDEMIERLDDSFRRQRQFTADASHELRTPLTVMKGQVEVALQRERPQDEYRDVLSAVNEEVDRLIRLASSLLTLARADAGEIPLELESIHVHDLVIGAVESLTPLADKKGIEIGAESGEDITVQVDEDLMLHLLLNLIDNAIKYTPSGGRVSVGWEMAGDVVELWVKDTGVGIAQEHIPHIMDRFYRVDNARNRSEGGVGLGLAISRWIVEAHGGSLRVESVLGEGSTFTIAIPHDKSTSDIKR